jgi:hypothetical protein
MSRPNELACAPFIFPKIIERIGTHRSKDRVFRLSPESITLFCMLALSSAGSLFIRLSII